MFCCEGDRAPEGGEANGVRSFILYEVRKVNEAPIQQALEREREEEREKERERKRERERESES